MTDFSDAIATVEGWVKHSGRWGRGLRLAGYGIQALSVIPLAILGGCASELLSPNHSLIQNSATLLSFMGIWITIWSAGRALLAHGNAYGLRAGQLMDLELYLSCLTGHELEPEQVINVILSFRRRTMEKNVSATLDDKLIRELLKKIPDLSDKTP